ncbi:MAG: hypothetical protein CME26_14620 [Gemmatimonadetes bacterium]|nr:hypothetical protein [Gemmatimonadota bacterium]|tara:strand:+ start:2203 stop:3078 length:876 start_codon:yes stop_codon:yes gene_type:complete
MPITPLSKRYSAAYTAALLLHLLFLLLLEPARRFTAVTDPTPILIEPEPLAFEFVESEADPENTPPDQTNLLADRNARSRDRNQSDLPRSHLVYNEGMFESKDAFETQMGRDFDRLGDPRGSRQSNRTGRDGARDPMWRERTVQEGHFTQEQREAMVYGLPLPAAQSSVPFDNTASRALEEGGLQLSTYTWDFAPYLKYLKRRIQSHIFPPAAFTRLGIIEGKNTIRFRIHPDGTLDSLTVLARGGSDLLLTTSRQAVELSAPFRPLPEDFPEPFLEITALFGYIIYRGAG